MSVGYPYYDYRPVYSGYYNGFYLALAVVLLILLLVFGGWCYYKY
jgi:hypothetical protein